MDRSSVTLTAIVASIIATLVTGDSFVHSMTVDMLKLVGSIHNSLELCALEWAKIGKDEFDEIVDTSKVPVIIEIKTM